MMDVWSRHPLSPGENLNLPAEGSENRTAERSEKRSAAAQEREDMCFVYPVLQPVQRQQKKKKKKNQRRGNGGGSGDDSGLPWSGEESRTFLRFSVFFANPFNR